MIPQNARNEADFDDSLSPISYSTGHHNYRPPFSSDSNWGAKRQNFRTFYQPHIQIHHTNEGAPFITNIQTANIESLVDKSPLGGPKDMMKMDKPQCSTTETNTKRPAVCSNKTLERQSRSQFDFTQLSGDHGAAIGHYPVVRSSLEAALQGATLSNPPKTASRANRSTIMSRMPVTSVHIRRQTMDNGSIVVIRHNRSNTGSSIQGRHKKRESGQMDGPSVNPEPPKVILTNNSLAQNPQQKL